MAYVHTKPFRTAAFGQGVDGARLVVRYDRAVIPPDELIPSLGDAAPVATPAASGSGWGSIAAGIAQAALPALIQVGTTIYAGREAKKDLAKQEDLARAEAQRAQQAMQAAMASRPAAPQQASGIDNTTLIIGGMALAGLLVVVLAMRR